MIVDGFLMHVVFPLGNSRLLVSVLLEWIVHSVVWHILLCLATRLTTVSLDGRD